mgnify:FL=1
MVDGLEAYHLRRDLQDLLFQSGKYIDGGGSGYNIVEDVADFDLQVKSNGMRFNIKIKRLEDDTNEND